MRVSPLGCHVFLSFNIEFCWFICSIDFFTKSFNNFFYLLQLTSTSFPAPTQCPLSPKLLLNLSWMSISLLPSLHFTRLCSAKKYLDIKMGSGNLPHFLCGPYFGLKMWGTASTHWNCNLENQSILTHQIFSWWMIFGIVTVSDAKTGW